MLYPGHWSEQTGVQAMSRRIAADLPEIRYVLQNLPTVARRLVDEVLEQDGKLPIPDRHAMYRRERRQYQVIGGAAGVVAAALLLGLGAEPAWLGWVVGAASLVALFLGRPKPPVNGARSR